MYDENMTSASKSALVEVASALHIYRNDFILAGGWIPYFLTRQYFDHCGSKDIDLVLRPSVMPRYESIRQIVERLGYSEVADNPFRFERQVPSPIDKQMYRVELDFLTEPSAAQNVHPFVKIQRDLRACLIEGSSIVFKLNLRESVEGVLPGDGTTSVEIGMASVAGCLIMKGLALPRLSDKDSYDIYAVAGFYGGGPKEASQAFLDDLRRAQMEEQELTALNNGLNRIRVAFKDADSQGPYAASRFSNQITRTDSFVRVNTFLTGLPSMFR